MMLNLISEAKVSVSWVLCTNRDDALLRRAIDSCLCQTYEDFELVLVVNGEECREIASELTRIYASDPRVKVHHTAVRLLNYSLSWGVHMASGEFIARMDSDDISDPMRLERQVSFMRAHPDVAVLGSAYQLIDDESNSLGMVKEPADDISIRRSLYYRNPICHPSAMLRRNVIAQLGGYLGGQNAEDYDLWLRVCMLPDWKFANIDDCLLSYRYAPGEARRSRRAYANLAGAQLRNFLLTRNPMWLLGAFLSVARAFLRATRD